VDPTKPLTLPDPAVLRDRLAQLTRERALVKALLRLAERARREQTAAPRQGAARAD
jgi:hypothetical protein